MANHGAPEDKPTLLERLSSFLTREPEDREELLALLHGAYERRLIDADALSMIEGVLSVSETTVRDIMIPRAQMDCVSIDDEPPDFIALILDTKHSRFPVIGESKDDVVGILLAKELLNYYANSEAFNLRETLRPAVFVPESKRLNVLLREFRANRNHIAIVVDEYGGVSGLVTIEDVLEQIVGDIEDEYDFDESEDNIIPEANGHFRVKAQTEIARFQRAVRHVLRGRAIRHRRRPAAEVFRAPAQARRGDDGRGIPLPGAARRQPSAATRCTSSASRPRRPTTTTAVEPAAMTLARALSLSLAAAAGAATVFGFAPFGLSALPLATLTVLLWQWHDAASPRNAAGTGFAFGLGLFGAGASWLYIAIQAFGGMPAPLAALAIAFLVAYLAMWPAAAGWLAARSTRRQSFLRLLVAAGAFTLAEWLRGFVFTGFPWLSVGYSQVPGGLLRGYAPIGGVFMVSLSMSLCAALLVHAAGALARGARREAALAACGTAALVATGTILAQVEWTRPAGEPVAVSLVQGNIVQEEKFDPDFRNATYDRYLRLVDSSRGRLIVLPEIGVPGVLRRGARRRAAGADPHRDGARRRRAPRPVHRVAAATGQHDAALLQYRRRARCG